MGVGGYWTRAGMVGKVEIALTRWLSWLEHCPIRQKVVGSIPSQGTYLGCRFDPQLGYVWEATNRCFSFSLSLKLIKYILE